MSECAGDGLLTRARDAGLRLRWAPREAKGLPHFASRSILAVHDQTALQEHEKWLAAGKYRRWCRALSCALQTWNAHIIAVGRLRARRLDECRIIAREDAMTSLDFTGHYRGE